MVSFESLQRVRQVRVDEVCLVVDVVELRGERAARLAPAIADFLEDRRARAFGKLD